MRDVLFYFWYKLDLDILTYLSSPIWQGNLAGGSSLLSIGIDPVPTLTNKAFFFLPSVSPHLGKNS
jgi:hypothetical protein